ncbi:MAG: hypothetical protein K2X94_00515 [Amoebophilaceae bacterium]|nr:hypothetical protein [Amoebophilaceae bacterium]
MYFLEGFEKALKTIYLIVYPYLELESTREKKNLTCKALKKAYLSYLGNKHKGILFPSTLSVEFLINDPRIDVLKHIFKLPDHDKESVVYYESTWIKELLAHAYNYLRNFDQSLFTLFELSTSIVFTFVSHVPGSETVSAVPSIIHINPGKNWSNSDVIEVFIHEMTHTLLFLDEQRYGHYKSLDAINHEKYYALTGILNKKSPVYLVLHSIIVASELLSLRNTLRPIAPKFHPNTVTIIANAKRSFDSLCNVTSIDEILLPRALELLSKAYQNIINHEKKLFIDQ